LIEMTRAQAEQLRSRPFVTMAGRWRGFDQSGGSIYHDTGAMRRPVLLQLPDAPRVASSRDNLMWCWAAARTFFSLGSKPNVPFNAHIPMERGLNRAMQTRTTLAVGFAKLIGRDANEAADAIAASTADGSGALRAEPLATEQAISSAITGVRAVSDTMLAGRRHRSGPG
jgi:hypothetical protein